ncbi:MAG: hypothetical protein ACYC96_15535 [Fimbriimonadaceae bacterium]
MENGLGPVLERFERISGCIPHYGKVTDELFELPKEWEIELRYGVDPTVYYTLEVISGPLRADALPYDWFSVKFPGQSEPQRLKVVKRSVNLIELA